MSKTKTASSARKPSIQEHAVASQPESPAPDHGFKTHWQGGNPFDRLELSPKADKASRR